MRAISERVAVSYRGVGEVISVGRQWQAEVERLSREADPESQAALNRLLDQRGHVQGRVRGRNLNTTVGLNLIGAAFAAAGLYIGLKAAGTPSAADTMASHASWLEQYTVYTQATRPALTLGAWSGGSASNSAARAIFTASSGFTNVGWFVVTNATKGGTNPTLTNVADWGSPAVLATGAALRVQLTATVT